MQGKGQGWSGSHRRSGGTLVLEWKGIIQVEQWLQKGTKQCASPTSAFVASSHQPFAGPRVKRDYLDICLLFRSYLLVFGIAESELGFCRDFAGILQETL